MRAGANLRNGSIGELEIVDITNPASPLTLGTYRPFPLPFSTRLKMAGTLAFLTNSYDGGTQILDVTDPLSPILRGTIPEATAVQIVGQLAYVVNPAGLRIYAIGDPDAPQLRGSLTTPFAAEQLVVADERAYVLGRRYEYECQYCNNTVAHLTIVDVHDPTAPTILGTLDPLGQGQSFPGDVMAIRGTTLYVLADGKLQIVDVSNPSAPAIRGTLGGAAEIQIDGTYAYTASTYQGLTVFDISKPANPTVIGTASTGLNFVDQLAVSNGLAFLSLSGGGLRVIDATRPRAPLLRGSYPRYPFDIQVVGDMIYFLDGPLHILRAKPSGFTNPAYVPLAYR